MKRKYILFFMQFLTSVCMVSVGFASWTIVSGDSLTAYGNIVAEDVFDHNNFIKFKENIHGITYCSAGFLDENFKVTDVATCTANLLIMADECKAQYSSYNSLKIEVLFKYSEYCNYDLFNNENSDISHSVFINNIPVTTVTTEHISTDQEGINGNYKIIIILENYIKEAPITDTTDVLKVQIHFSPKTEFSIIKNEVANMNFECKVSMEGIENA